MLSFPLLSISPDPPDNDITISMPVDPGLIHEAENGGIELPINDDVKEMIKFFQVERRESIEKALALMDRHLDDFKEIMKEEGLPQVFAYLPFIESAYDPLALSNQGARGIWQFMPYTARHFGLRVDGWIDERIHPEKSCRAATRYLKTFYEKFGDWTLALAAYNAGPTRIKRAVRKLGTTDFWEIKKSRYIKGQTKRYIPAFIAGVHIARFPEKYGFFIQPKPAEPHGNVTIPTQTDLSVIAKCAGTDVATIKKMNPELRKLMTPYKYKNYPLRLPADCLDKFKTNFTKIPEEERITQIYHKIRPGDTLSQIARKYSTTVSSLMKANNISSPKRLIIGDNLVVPIAAGSNRPPVKTKSISRTKASYTNGEKIIYTVIKGDSLYRIAYRFRTDIYSLINWNEISAQNPLFAGKQLTVYYATRINATESEKATPSGEGFLVYTVRLGDTLYDIAQEHNVTVTELFKYNTLRSSRIMPGDKIKIPVEDKSN